MKRFAVILAGWYVAGAVALAQCAMCKEALVRSEEGRQLVAGMNRGILFLLAMPFLIIGCVAWKFYRANRRTRCHADDSLAGQSHRA